MSARLSPRRYLFYGTQLYALPILRPLQEAIRRRGDEAAWFLIGQGAKYLRPDEHLLQSVEAVKAFDPLAVFVPGNVVPDFFPGIKVDVFHGFNARKRPANRGHCRIRGFFDLYCTQGPDTTRNFEPLARKYKFFEVVETGWPKMDPLFADAGPINPRRPATVLFTSTFTPKLSAAEALRGVFGRLAAAGRWRFLVNFHPKMDPDVIRRYRQLEGERLKLIETDETAELLKSADLMVSDTSSILSEFLLLHKPVVTFRNRRPGPHLIDISDPGQLERSIEYGLTRPRELMTAIKKYAADIHPYRDGQSSARVLEAVDRFIQRGRGHLRKRPLNLIRRLKIRRQLGYYRWR